MIILTKYQEMNGTSYHLETPYSLVLKLESLRMAGIRVKIEYGDSQTGKRWGDGREPDTVGTIGRSWGPIKIPLLIYNKRSIGGGAILDHCIVKLSTSKGGAVLYQHPNYH